MARGSRLLDGVAGSNPVTGGDGIDTCKLKGSVTSSGCEEQSARPGQSPRRQRGLRDHQLTYPRPHGGAALGGRMPLRSFLVGLLALFYLAGPADAQTCFTYTPTIIGEGKIKGTPGNDIIAGSFSDDVIDGGGGSDLICGSLGNDRIKARDGAVVVDGGPGNDRINVRTGGFSAQVVGGSGDDVVKVSTAGAGGNLVYGQEGNDAIRFDSDGGGSNLVQGNDGDDVIKTRGGGGDTVDAGSGTDTCKTALPANLISCEQ